MSSRRSKIILISVLSVILGIVCLLSGRSLYKPVIPAQGADPAPTGVAYDPTKQEGTKENPFTILEIVPNYSYAQIGFLINGQEPVNVYGAGGILENARAGYKGAYNFLIDMSEFTVTGAIGDKDGVGEGIVGGVGSTIYAFDDEKAYYVSTGEVPADAEWVAGEEIDRVTEYYTVSTPEKLEILGPTQYELVKVYSNNIGDSFNGQVYEEESNEPDSFQTATSEQKDDSNITKYKFNNNKIGNYNSKSTHQWASDSVKDAAKNFKTYTRTKSGTKYRYSEALGGDFVYYNGYMYQKDSDGSYVIAYKKRDYIYKMVVAEDPTDDNVTYYLKGGPLDYEDNTAHFDNSNPVDGSVVIEGGVYNSIQTSKALYYTYTIEDTKEYVFEDEQRDGVTYREVGETERVGLYYLVNDDALNKSFEFYEYKLMLKSKAEDLGWVTENWGGMGLDGFAYSKTLLTGFKRVTETTSDEKYDRPDGFVPAVDYNGYIDKGSNGQRYEQKEVTSTDVFVGGDPEDWKTYTFVPASSDPYEPKPENWTGDTYNYNLEYIPLEGFSNGKYTIPGNVTANNLYFVTFSTKDTKNTNVPYSVNWTYRYDDKKEEVDPSNKYFYELSGSEYKLAVNDYEGEANGKTTGFLFWKEWEGNNYYLVTFTKYSSGTKYYVISAVPYANTGNGNTINSQIASMLYTKKEAYVKAEDGNGQYILSQDRYEYDPDGAYVYYDGKLYRKLTSQDEFSGNDYVLYTKNETSVPSDNYYYFKNEGETEYHFYRMNPAGDYIAEYDFQKDANGDYIYWLRPLEEGESASVGHPYYYRKGLCYADNKAYFDDDTIKNKVMAEADLPLADTRSEKYYIESLTSSGGVEGVYITHSNVFLKNVMHLDHKDNDPAKALDIDQFEFAGWYTEKEGINKYDFENTILRTNIELYAKWIPKTSEGKVYENEKYYTVKFYASGTATKESYIAEYLNSDLSISINDVAYKPVHAKETGKDYIFLGWSTEKNGSGEVLTKIKYKDIPEDNREIKLYPVWEVLNVAEGKVTDAEGNEVKYYTVEFKLTKDDEASFKTFDVYKNGYIKPKDKVSTNENLASVVSTIEPEAQAGKKFVGWYATEDNPVFIEDVPYDFSSPLADNVTLYACWVEDNEDLTDIQYTITFNDNVESVESLLLNKENQKVEESSFHEQILVDAFKDDKSLNDAKLKPSAGNTTPRLMSNVQYKASQYKVEVKTVLPSELNDLYDANKLDELLSKADMIVVSNSKNSAYSDIFKSYSKYGNNNTKGYSSTNDLNFDVATAILKKSMEAGSAPILLDKALLDCTKSLDVYKLFVMLQSMDASMFYDSFVRTDVPTWWKQELWARVDANGKYNNNSSWNSKTFITALGLDNSELVYYGIDKNYETIFSGSSSYPTSLTNHCYVYSGEVFNNGTKFTNKTIGPDAFYTNSMFAYFYGDDVTAYSGKSCAPADAVQYMTFGYQPEAGLDETTAILEIQPEHTFKTFKYWYMYVKKYIPNYSGKLIVDCKNTQKTIYLGNAEGDECETLTVRQMSTLEFVGVISDLNSDYRMIYIGGDLSRDNADEMEIDENYYAYLHTGNTESLQKKVLGVLGGDKDELAVSCYPGNDITAAKMSELYDYCAKAKATIIIGKELAVSDGSAINTLRMDTSSNLYQLFANAENGLLGSDAPCYVEGTVSYDTMSALMNDDRVRLLVSEVPPTYVEGQSDYQNYLNPYNQESRVLEYKFVLQGKKDTEYKVRLFIDMNADGQFNRATEMLDSLVIRTDKTVLSHRATLEAGKEYTVQRSISDYVGVMPWKLEVYEVGNEAVRHSITGMTAIKPVKKNEEGTGYEKEKLNILQVTSAKDAGNSLASNNVYMPTTEEMEALSALGDNYKNKKYNELSSSQKTTVNNILTKVSTGKDCAYDFWLFLSTLKDFDISITRVSLAELAAGISTGLHDGAEFKMDNFNMLILGFADCYNEITDEASLVAVEDFIESGKSVLFTHDGSSYINYSSSKAGSSIQYYWGYNINKRFRNMLGMDRYGVTVMYGNENKQQHTTSLMGTLTSSGFVADEQYEDVVEIMKKKDVLYKYGTNQESIWLDGSKKAYVQGFSRVLISDNSNGVENHKTTKVSNVNGGQITKYPYTIPESFTVAETHSQYYQLDLEANDIVVWYCLASNGNSASSVFNQFYNDVRSSYYIYSKGNIMYTGVGHSVGLSENEIKLFINTMVAAYMSSADPTAPKIVNFDRTTGAEIDYVYVDYDSTNPELAIGEGVKDAESYQTKEINFKLQENSIVTNKLMTVYVYDTGVSGDYQPMPMEMQVRKYTGDNTINLAKSTPVFVVTTNRSNEEYPEYAYTEGQVLAIDSNAMVQGGSIDGTKVTIGDNTYTVPADGNGFYVDFDSDGSKDLVSVKAMTGLDESGTPVYSASELIYGYIYMAPIVKAGEEYAFDAPIGGLQGNDIVRYLVHVNLRYGKRQDKSKDGFADLSIVRRGMFNLD